MPVAEDGSTVPASFYAKKPAASGGGGGWDESAHPRDTSGGLTAGQWVPVGKARDEAGAKAQKDKGASKNYDALLHGSSSGQAKLLTGMKDDDLKKLTAFVYSSKTDNPAVVRGRMAVAAEMGKRGLDVKDYGALGGGIEKKKTLKASGVTELAAELGEDGSWRFPAVVAAAIPAAPPAAWFQQRSFDGPTPLTFTADGQVYGHIADRTVPHIGLPGHRTAPRSPSGYRWYHTGQVRCDDDTLVATGRITMGAGHASLDASAEAATAHYDNTAAAVADVVAWDDEYGVAVAGAARPGTTPEQMRAAMASPPSGDWRVIGNDLEMVAALLVNVPGFPTPRAGIAASGAVMALVAAGCIPRTPQEAVVSAPTPPAPPAPEDGPSADGTVTIGDTGLVGQVIEESDAGVVVEVTVPAEELHSASEQDAVAAAAKLTTRQQLRAMSASITALSDQIAARDRADTARTLLASLPD